MHSSTDFDQIGEALNFLRENRSRRPSLDEVAAHVGLSPHHFQRKFSAWAGVSPKQFLQYLTVEHVKSVLDETKSLLEAAYESGLSGPGRLHDLFVTVEAMTPAEYRDGGANLTVRYGTHECPLGHVTLAITGRGICGLSFEEERLPDGTPEYLVEMFPNAQFIEDGAATQPIADRLFTSRRPDDGPFAVHVHGTNFQLQVWRALVLIPPGHAVSYGDLAGMLGKPKAARAVGNAVANNPVSLLIPCHRVIREMGVVGRYRWGSARKSALIGREAVARFG